MTTDTMTATERSSSANSSPLPTGRRLLDVRQVAAFYGADERSIFRWADCGVIPHGIKLGALRKWDSLLVEQHLAAGCPRVRTVTTIGGAR